MEAVRTGDARLFEFVQRPRLSLRECPPEEISAAMEAGIRRQDWVRLFADCRTVPLRLALPGWEALVQSGWQPPEAHDAALVQLLATELSGIDTALAAPEPPQGTSAVFERWLAEGRDGELAGRDEAALLSALASANPPEAVPIVAALAARGQVSEAARTAVFGSAHWLIRLAGHVTGMAGLGESADPSKDSNFWVRELGVAGGVWDFWPTEGTAAHLDQLDRGPREAMLGAAGRARRMLRAVLAHGVMGVTVERDVVAPDEGAMEVTKIERKPAK